MFHPKMSVLRLVLVMLACVGLAVAESEPFQVRPRRNAGTIESPELICDEIQGIVYSKGKFRGRSRIIPPDGWCWNLGVGLRNNVKSVRIVEGGHCEFFQ